SVNTGGDSGAAGQGGHAVISGESGLGIDIDAMSGDADATSTATSGDTTSIGMFDAFAVNGNSAPVAARNGWWGSNDVESDAEAEVDETETGDVDVEVEQEIELEAGDG